MSTAAVLPERLRGPLREAQQRLQAMYGDRLRRVILYGSQARGDAREDSDIDVLVVLDGPFDLYQETKPLATLHFDLFERYRLDFSFKPYALCNASRKGMRSSPKIGEDGRCGEYMGNAILVTR